MRMALIDGGKAVNIIVASEGYAPPEGQQAVPCDASVAIGWTWDGQAFAAPPVPVPQVVSDRQFRLALLTFGLLDAAEAFVAAAGPEVRIYWDRSLEIARDHGLVTGAIAALGKTDADADDLFRLAATL